MLLFYSNLPPGYNIDQDFIEKNPILTFPHFFLISVSPLIYIEFHSTVGAGSVPSFFLSWCKSNETVTSSG